MKHGDKNNYYDEKVASATQRSVSLAPWHERLVIEIGISGGYWYRNAT
jgi:hypothetical protein